MNKQELREHLAKIPNLFSTGDVGGSYDVLYKNLRRKTRIQWNKFLNLAERVEYSTLKEVMTGLYHEFLWNTERLFPDDYRTFQRAMLACEEKDKEDKEEDWRKSRREDYLRGQW